MSRPDESMQCHEVLELLEARLDGDLSRDEDRAVTDHLAGCARCAREAALAEAIRSELRALPEYEAPPELVASLRWTVGRDRPRRVRLRPLMAVAAGLVIAVLAGLLYYERPTARPSMDDPEIARATAETRYALALVGAVGSRAGLEDLFGERVLSPTVSSVTRVLRERLSLSLGERPRAEPEDTNSEGSQG